LLGSENVGVVESALTAVFRIAELESMPLIRGFISAGGFDCLDALLDSEHEHIRVGASVVFRTCYLHRPMIMKQAQPYMKKMVDILPNFTASDNLLDHIVSLLCYLVNSNGEVLHAYITTLREHGAIDVIRSMEGEAHTLEVAAELANLKGVLSHTSRLWDLNLSIIHKGLSPN
jgi:hypothetical protein